MREFYIVAIVSGRRYWNGKGWWASRMVKSIEEAVRVGAKGAMRKTLEVEECSSGSLPVKVLVEKKGTRRIKAVQANGNGEIKKETEVKGSIISPVKGEIEKVLKDVRSFFGIKGKELLRGIKMKQLIRDLPLFWRSAD